MTQLQAFLAGPGGVALVAALAVLTVLFLVLWLRAKGGGGAEGGKELKAAQNQLRLVTGDLMQAKKDHEAEVARLKKEVENWRAQAGGQEPPELVEFRRRALEAEGRLQTEIAALTERHKKEVQILEAALGKSSVTGTIIAPSSAAVRDRMDRMEKDLAEAQSRLEAATARHQAELQALADRLSAEKAAAITALSERHAAELEAARSGQGGGARAPRPLVDAQALSAGGGVPESARFPYLEIVAGAGTGTKHFLPFGTITIGRASTCTIPIEDTQASRNHAEVSFDGVDFRVKDNNSTNGTSVNEKAVPAARLDFGDVIGIGEYRFRFGAAAHDAAPGDPAFAAAAYEAMVRLAPDFRLALRDLAALLERDPGRSGDVQDLRDRLAALPASQAA
jgi:hypothetical protein